MLYNQRMGDVINFYHQDREYGEFSNFYLAPINIQGVVYPTSEHYFQAAKFFTTDQDYANEVARAGSPGQAARLGRTRAKPLRSDWESVKDDFMRLALSNKFVQHEKLGDVLIRTGSARLVEHTKNDSYWGDGGDGSGMNVLGVLLMELRPLLAHYVDFNRRLDAALSHLEAGAFAQETVHLAEHDRKVKARLRMV